MPNITTVFSVAIFIALGVIFWKNFGVGSGRSFGNKIAKHTGLNQNTFWYLMNDGSKGPALDFLKSLEQSNMDLDQASIAVGPTLQRGLNGWKPALAPRRRTKLQSQSSPSSWR